MKHETQRQGMVVTPKELRLMADKLEDEYYQSCPERGIDCNPNEMEFLVSIINKEEASDTWRFEK